MTSNPLPITERANPRTENIDLLDPLEIVKVLTECEQEIFGGYEGSKGVYDPGFLDRITSFAKVMRKAIREEGKIDLVIIGAGTSGRICRLLAKVFRPVAKGRINIIPVIAGGIKALVRAQPNTEDKKEEGEKDYLNFTSSLDRSKCFVIGVSCGLSASYVVGALDNANKFSVGRTAIIGFNPKELATVELGESIKLLNPIVGPEAIMGSVRMKGGTATMVLIYSLIKFSLGSDDNGGEYLTSIFRQCQETLVLVLKYQTKLSQLIRDASMSLRVGGSVYLAGSSRYGGLCIYDAAECPPTFGARVNQVNGYTAGGILDFVYYPGEEKEQMAKEIQLKVFVKDILPGLTEDDIVLTIREAGEDNDIFGGIQAGRLKNLYSLEILSNGKKSVNPKELIVTENWKDDFLKLLFVRSLLIQLSTGSFVLSGKVFKNKMIDLRITNKKLFLRAIRIVNQITGKDEESVRKVLLRNIYESEVIPSQNTLENHIDISAGKESIVPLTILGLIYPEKVIQELRQMLQEQPIVRKLVIDQLKNLESV